MWDEKAVVQIYGKISIGHYNRDVDAPTGLNEVTVQG